MWGSGWPFVRHDARMDHGPEFACVVRWLPAETNQQKLMWETPKRLFGFA